MCTATLSSVPYQPKIEIDVQLNCGGVSKTIDNALPMASEEVENKWLAAVLCGGIDDGARANEVFFSFSSHLIG